MEVFSHRDPQQLVDAFRRHLEAKIGTDRRIVPLLVVAPSSRLIRFLQRELVKSRAYVGLTWQHHQSLTEAILDQSDREFDLMPTPVFEAAVKKAISKRSVIGRYMARHPRGIQSFAETLRELRDSGLKASEVRSFLEASSGKWKSPLDQSALECFCALDQILDEVAKEGWADRLGLVRRALPLAGEYARRFEAIFHFGAYELIGVHRLLFRELASHRPTQVYLPGDEDVSFLDWAQNRAKVSFPDEASWKVLDTPSASVFSRGISRLGLSSDEELTETWPLKVFDAPGPRAELTYAARRARQWIVEQGVDPRDIGVLARTLEPYEPHLLSVFQEQKLPFTTSAKSPLLRWPGPRAALDLLRALSEGLSPPTLDAVIRASAIDWDSLLGAPLNLQHIDRIARDFGPLIGGAAWRSALDQRPHEPAERSFRRLMGLLLDALETWEGCRGPKEHASFLSHLLERFLGDRFRKQGPGSHLASVGRALESLALLQDLGLESQALRPEDVLAWLNGVLRNEVTPVQSNENQGVRVFDVMQARGHAFRHVILLGFNADQFPRRGSEDPYFSDSQRRALSEASGCPLSIKGDSSHEERLLLALTLASASETVEVGYQRTDEGDGTRRPSLMIRELANAAKGVPRGELLLQQAQTLSGHPTFALQESAQWFGFLTPHEAARIIALGSADPRGDLQKIQSTLPFEEARIFPSLEFVERTEAFASGDLRFDGCVGGAYSPPELSPSKLELLGKCPLRFFFRYVLKIEEPRADRSELIPQARDIGDGIHEVLFRLYESLGEKGVFESGDPEQALVEARAALDRLLKNEFESLRLRFGPHAAGVLEGFWRRWSESVRRFVEEDLPRLIEEGWVPESLERRMERTLDIKGHRFSMSGQMDRCFGSKSGDFLIGDYKTGSLRNRTNWSEILKGRQLQMPLYMLMAHQEFESTRVAGEFLGVAPRYQGRSASPNQKTREQVNTSDFDRERDVLETTLKTLGDLLKDGHFPFQSVDPKTCQYCAYQRGCRRLHPPSDQRLRGDKRFAPYFALETLKASPKKKVAKKPLSNQTPNKKS